MKALILFSLILFGSLVHADPFEISRDCRKTIKADLKTYGHKLVRILYTNVNDGGSDGVSSYDPEYVVKASLRNNKGEKLKALLYLYELDNCRVIRFFPLDN